MRSLGTHCWSLFWVITGMWSDEVNHVSPSNQESFFRLWFDNGHSLFGPDASDGSKSCHTRPGLGQEFEFEGRNSLPKWLGMSELCVIGASLF